ncbi:putative disease resistance protein RGA1 [Lolium rigidum]|uniref:putative disease resistance protein RGA1 n=1 Tax=Lolium rigidum TaxID=89674 RepID=UPI001F5DCDF0|nr:putative disease resistance protein RGA1 [Lolium rigidum]
MAEVLISAVVGDMVGRVISLLASRCSNQEQSTNDKLQKISRMLIRIHSVVEEAKGRHITNHVALDWLSDLDDGVWQGRYLLDTVGCRETEHEEDGEGDGEEVQPFSLSSFNPAKRIRVVAASTMRCVLSRDAAGVDEIHRVLENLQGLSGDLREFLMLLQGCKRIRRPLSTNIFVDSGQMFGRHVERERIINFLLHDDYSPSSEEKLPLLPIVGDIGVGKTTLVQHVCDDARLRSRFPLIMLFDFSSTYAIALGEAAVVLKSKHVIGGSGNLKHPLHVLNESFRSKRFLMVFEDVDMHKKKMLEELLPSLRRHGKQGSKIIVTTNNMRVAASMGTVASIRLKVLPHPEYWFFFKAHAFAATDVEENPRLLAVGRAIAMKLNGSFFGAKIVGGVLRAHPDLRLWCKILRSDIGGLSLLGDGLGYIADLAENLLPSHVSMRQLIITKKPFRSTQPKFAMFHDMFLPSPDGAPESCSADVGNAKVLLCRSVLPFYCVYYTMLIAL